MVLELGGADRHPLGNGHSRTVTAMATDAHRRAPGTTTGAVTAREVPCPVARARSTPSPTTASPSTQDYLEHAGEEIYGQYVFSDEAQRKYLAKPIYQQAAPDDRRPRAVRPDRSSTPSPTRVKEWALAPRRDALHALVRAHDRLHCREARLVPDAHGRRRDDRRVLRQDARPGRARRVVLPVGRHPRHVRGARLHRVGRHLARSSSRSSRTA